MCKFVFSLGIFVVKFRYGEKLRDLKYGHAEWGINMCFIYSILIYSQYASMHANKQLVKIVTVLWSHIISYKFATYENVSSLYLWWLGQTEDLQVNCWLNTYWQKHV